MSDYVPKDDTAQLFRQAERKTDTSPEYEGEFKIRCPHCGQGLLGWLKAWVRTTKRNDKYFSIAFKHRQKGGGQ